MDANATKDVDLLQMKAENFDRLMKLIKDNLSIIKTNREIIQGLIYLTKKEKILSQDTINLVTAFYEDHEFSWQMPVKKLC